MQRFLGFCIFFPLGCMAIVWGALWFAFAYTKELAREVARDINTWADRL